MYLYIIFEPISYMTFHINQFGYTYKQILAYTNEGDIYTQNPVILGETDLYTLVSVTCPHALVILVYKDLYTPLREID